MCKIAYNIGKMAYVLKRISFGAGRTGFALFNFRPVTFLILNYISNRVLQLPNFAIFVDHSVLCNAVLNEAKNLNGQK